MPKLYDKVQEIGWIEWSKQYSKSDPDIEWTVRARIEGKFFVRDHYHRWTNPSGCTVLDHTEIWDLETKKKVYDGGGIFGPDHLNL